MFKQLEKATSQNPYAICKPTEPSWKSCMTVVEGSTTFHQHLMIPQTHSSSAMVYLGAK